MPNMWHNDSGKWKPLFIVCQNKAIKCIRGNFISKAINIAPELRQLYDNNIIKYCLVMSNPNLQYITARYISDILSSYDLENKSIINSKYIEIFM